MSFLRTAARQVEAVSLESGAPSALLITKTVGVFIDLEVLEVRCNGEPAAVLVETNYSWLYRCAVMSDDPAMAWQAKYVASAPGIVDVVLVPFRR
jgi:hypothetical protein